MTTAEPYAVVTRDAPCAICGRDRWCTRAPSGYVRCMRDGDPPTGWERVAGRPNLYRPTGHTAARAPSAPPAPSSNGRVYASLDDAIAAAARAVGVPHTARYEYHDGAGDLHDVVLRFDAPDGKQYRPLHLDATGWHIGATKSSRPLYGIPALRERADEVVYVCEGEKCCDALAPLGMLAVTSSGGSAAPRYSDWSPLSGRSVYIIPDADAPGAKYAATVAELLRALDPPASVRIADPLGPADSGYDVADLIRDRCAAGATDELIAAEIRAHTDRAVEPLRAGPVVVRLADVERREVAWLWPGRIPLGRITLLVGRPGDGKSFVTLDASARVSTGALWPDGARCPVGGVLLVCAEDDPGDTIAPRLDACGADDTRVSILRCIRRIGDDGAPYETCLTLADVGDIERAIGSVPHCRLVIVDPIGSYMGSDVDSHRDTETRAVLAPIAALAERLGVAVVIVAHTRKAGVTHADDAALGSRAFVGLARSVLHVRRDPASPERRLLLAGKSNLAREAPGLAFSILGDSAGRPALAWEPGTVDMRADDCVRAEAEHERSRPGPDADARHEAEAYLRRALADGPRPAREVAAEARDGEGISVASLRRARRTVGVDAYRPAIPGPWWWRLGAVFQAPQRK